MKIVPGFPVAAFHPAVALGIVAVLVVLAILFVGKLARGIRGLFRSSQAGNAGH